MGHVRAALRLLGMGAFTALMYATLAATAPIARLLRGSSTRWRVAMFKAWSRGMARMLGMRMEVRGTPPRPPFFLVTNHLSYTDVLLLAAQTHCVFIAKSEVAGWPVFGRLCRAARTLFIRREAKRDILRVVEAIEKTLREAVGVVLFPEATSSEGRMVLPFRPALLEAAAQARFPVSYGTLTYRTPPGEPAATDAVCWWGDMSFGAHLLRLLRVRRFDAVLTFGSENIRDADRKALARKLQAAVQGQFQPVATKET